MTLSAQAPATMQPTHPVAFTIAAVALALASVIGLTFLSVEAALLVGGAYTITAALIGTCCLIVKLVESPQ